MKRAGESSKLWLLPQPSAAGQSQHELDVMCVLSAPISHMWWAEPVNGRTISTQNTDGLRIQTHSIR